MAMVIGLKSGKEFIVEEDSYLFFNEKTGLEVRMFISLDRKRIVTIPPDIGHIEYFDEPATEALLTDLKTSRAVTLADKLDETLEDVNVR